MKAVLALLLASIALSSALTITDPYYQAYYIYYNAVGCGVADVSHIELYDSWSYGSTGTGLNGACSAGSACTTYGTSGSYETVCVSGEPTNLGVKAIWLWSACDATSVMPFKDDYVSTGTWPTTREETDIATWRDGCNSDDGTYYNFASVNAGGAGCAVNDGGWCGTTAGCAVTDCSTSGNEYSLATASSGCAAGDSTYVYLECAATPFVPPATTADLFSYDPARIVFTQGNCGTGCPTYYLGDGFCDSACNNAGCDYDCDAAGVCDCCVPASVSSCCTPPAYGSTNVCCEVTPEDQELVANNTLFIKVFEACICDGINTNIDVDNEVSVDSTTGLCDFSNAMSTTTSSTTTGETACVFASVLSWCYGHAIQTGDYVESVGTSDTNTEWFAAVSESLSTTGPGDDMISPVPDCLALGGQFTTDASALTSVGGFPAGSVNGFCEGINTLYSCDVVCGSASTLALSALIAFVF